MKARNGTAAGSIVFQVASQGGTFDILRVNSNGNVGIKQDAPSYPLDVTGDINLTGSLRVGGVAQIGSHGSIKVSTDNNLGKDESSGDAVSCTFSSPALIIDCKNLSYVTFTYTHTVAADITRMTISNMPVNGQCVIVYKNTSNSERTFDATAELNFPSGADSILTNREVTFKVAHNGYALLTLFNSGHGLKVLTMSKLS